MSDYFNGLASPDFVRFDCTYDGSCPPFPAHCNSFLFSAGLNSLVPPSVTLADVIAAPVKPAGEAPTKSDPSLLYCRDENYIRVCEPM